jgi:hypothetical protein
LVSDPLSVKTTGVSTTSRSNNLNRKSIEGRGAGVDTDCDPTKIRKNRTYDTVEATRRYKQNEYR